MSWFNLNLRKKLIIYFILIVIIPIIFYIVFFNILGVYLNNMSSVIDVETVIKEFKNEIEENIESINNSEKFNNNINSLLTRYQGELQIIDPQNDLIVFDSTNTNNVKFNYLNLNSSSNIDTDNFSYLGEVKTEKGNYIFSIVFNRSTLFQSIQGKVIKYIVIGVIFSILLLGFLVYYFSRIISRQILIPLDELSEATKNITEGNLDYKIEYSKDNELGKFCEAFETMRLRLKKSLEKQSLYENNRKELIASISHDLKTPITSIQGYIEGLIDGVYQDEETFEKYLNIIKDKTLKLNHLIDDLFYYSKLEIDKLDVKTKEYNSQEVFDELLKPLELEFEEIEQKLVIYKPIPNVKINIDKKRIGQVIDNIIKNAREFIDEKGIIEISFTINENYFRVSISDNGLGIRDKDKKYIFDKFYRGEKSRSRKFGGTGLGLAICQEIIQAHNGEIGVKSVRGQGSTFYFELPIT